MASNNSRGRSNRGGRNNNPSGRNQYTGGGMIDMVRERPIAAATAAVGAAAAGVFLWSKRSQISDQIHNLSDQISEWREGMQSGDGEGFLATGDGRDQSDIAEEAMTLKQTGKKTKRPTDPTVDAQTKAGSVAY
ncbi:MAG TPA: hypothetical protein VF098_12270 [Sphingomicrobium sp.]|jgi:hypothetical protein